MQENVMPPDGISGLVHPLDIVEESVSSLGFIYERNGDTIELDWKGRYATYDLNFQWIEDRDTLHLACAFELKVPPHRLSEARELARLINERTQIGHFEVWDDVGVIMYRYGLILPADAALTLMQCQSMQDMVFGSMEYYYQAFQFVVWAGTSAKDALDAVQFDTKGEA